VDYLLDTHSFLWFLDGNSNLSSKAKKVIANPKNVIYISIASLWEIGIKLSLGKLNLDFELGDLKNEIIKNNFEILPLDFEHIIELTKLENQHKDPFDRILICQSLTENLTIITKDEHFRSYKKVKIYW
jgi:PIN domain nuclease of toxin-antitoxin system